MASNSNNKDNLNNISNNNNLLGIPCLSSLSSSSNSSSSSGNGVDSNTNWISVILNWLHTSHDRPAVQTEALWALTNLAGLVPPAGMINKQQHQSIADMTKNSNWPISNISSTNIISNNNNNNILGHVPEQTTTSTTQQWEQQQQQQRIVDFMMDSEESRKMYTNNSNANNMDAALMMNNAALSNFLEQAAMNGVSFDPQTLAAAVQLCATAATTTTATTATTTNNHWATTAATADAVMNMNHSQLQQFAAMSSSSSSSSFFPSTLFQGIPTSSLTTTATTTPTMLLPPSSTQYHPTMLLPPSSTQYHHNSAANVLLSHADALPTLISLLKSPHRQVHEQAMWIIGSVCVGSNNSSSSNMEDGNTTNKSMYHHSNHSFKETQNSQTSHIAAAREAVLCAGILEPLCSCLNENTWNNSLQRIGSWLLSNLVVPTISNSASTTTSNPTNSNSSGTNNTTTTTTHTDITHTATLDNTNSATNHHHHTNNNNDCNTSNSSKERSSGRDNTNNNNSNNTYIYFDVQIILPTLRRLLLSGDADVLSHTCWAFSHLCDGPSVHISSVVFDTVSSSSSSADYVTIPQRLVELLLHPSWRVTKPALRTIGNIVCAECATTTTASSMNTNTSDGAAKQQQQQVLPPLDYTEVVLQGGAIPKLKTLISHSNREIQKEACWTLSNIAAGTIPQIQAVMDCGAISPLVSLASDYSADHEVRSEACWVVLNATSCGSDEQVEQLVADGCVNVLKVLLKEASMVMMALEGLERVLQVEEAKQNKAISTNTTATSSVLGSVINASLIESLEQHKNTAVSKRAARIWKQHFVCCALCRQYFSRHSPLEARFCNECKCHVCSSCKCEIYHLSYQEELWKTTESTTATTTTSAAQASNNNNNNNNNNQTSKSKSKKKKQRKKEKKRKKDDTNISTNNKEDLESAASRSNNGTNNNKVSSNNNNNNTKDSSSKKTSKTINNNNNDEDSINHSSSVLSSEGCSDNGSLLLLGKHHEDNSILTEQCQQQQQQQVTCGDDPDEEEETKQITVRDATASFNCASSTTLQHWEKDGSDSIDFVLYLQQTGSIIALSKLMDALDFE